MKIILQRVSQGSLVTDGDFIGEIENGLVALVGFNPNDNEKTADYMINKMMNLRIFEDEEGYMNLSLLDEEGGLVVVPNFTLYANCKKGRRPSFTDAAHPDHASPLYDYFLQALKKEYQDVKIVAGKFGSDMQVGITNDGPVTIHLESDEIMPQN